MDESIHGLRQILWGLFKKIVVADNCGRVVDMVFDNSEAYSGSTLILATCLFSVQIYCDFSGYSEIAIGTAKLFGIRLMRNFNNPYFSKSISEFWRRWHISLTSWFRDYVYVPLGGNKKGTLITIRNIMIIFILSGLWHGANWTFVIWGFINGLFFIAEISIQKRSALTLFDSERFDGLKVMAVFILISVSWIFFRANSIEHATQIIETMFSGDFHPMDISVAWKPILLLIFMFYIEWLGRNYEYSIQRVQFLPQVARWSIYFTIVTLIGLLASEQQPFIYFQF